MIFMCLITSSRPNDRKLDKDGSVMMINQLVG